MSGMRLPDVSGEVPTRRMAVARGTLALAQAPGPAQVAAAQAAALLAVKHAATVQATAVPFQLTDCFCDVTHTDGSVGVTVTVQAMAREPLGHAAAAGALAALLALAGPAAEGRFQVELVQNVQD